MADLDAIRAAEDALDRDADPREVLQRFGIAAVRAHELGRLLGLLEGFDPGAGAAAVGRWTADLVDAGHLVPRDDA